MANWLRSSQELSFWSATYKPSEGPAQTANEIKCMIKEVGEEAERAKRDSGVHS